MSILGALISGAFGLFGANKDRRNDLAAIAAQNEYNKPLNVRKRAEEAGFNPLLFAGPGVGQQTGLPGTYIGSAIANAGMMLGDAVATSGAASAESRLNQYQQENNSLKKTVQSLTLRPKVGGIYAGNERARSRAEALNGPDKGDVAGVSGAGRNPSAGPAGAPPLLEVDPADPRREVDNKPVPTTSGVMVVDNPHAGRYYFPTIDGDEPVDLLDVPSIAVALPQVGYNFGDRLAYGGGRESAPSMSRADAIFAKDMREMAKKKPKKRPLKLTRPAYGAEWLQ